MVVVLVIGTRGLRRNLESSLQGYTIMARLGNSASQRKESLRFTLVIFEPGEGLIADPTSATPPPPPLPLPKLKGAAAPPLPWAFALFACAAASAAKTEGGLRPAASSASS
jgi:hypothetical protein